MRRQKPLSRTVPVAPEMTFLARKTAAASIVAIALLIGGLAPLGAAEQRAEQREDGSCKRHDVSVLLHPGELQGHPLAAWLCTRSTGPHQTVIIASPTGFTAHHYWDWPYEKETYSFVRHATQAGYAVLNYDRIGNGESERANAALINLETESYILHQLVDLLRAGRIGGTPFARVVTIGNSFSTFISVMEAATYQDVDAVINTGIWVGPRAEGLAELFAAFHPAQSDPKFADRDIPPGYATTLPGSRKLFFHLPAADPAMVELDERMKDTATAGEAATFPDWIPLTRRVSVPVLSVMGDHDFLFCRPECASGGPEEQRERTFWSPETCFEVHVVEDAGHALQWHRGGAARFRELAEDFLERRVGVDAAHPASEPCG